MVFYFKKFFFAQGGNKKKKMGKIPLGGGEDMVFVYKGPKKKPRHKKTFLRFLSKRGLN